MGQAGPSPAVDLVGVDDADRGGVRAVDRPVNVEAREPGRIGLGLGVGKDNWTTPKCGTTRPTGC